jgi:hypothetical protein
VSQAVIRISPEKINTVQEYPEPSKVPELPAFLGLTGCLRDFIPNYTSEALPLTNLLRKQNPWIWTNSERRAMDNLKQPVMKAAVLNIDDLVRPTPVRRCVGLCSGWMDRTTT